MFFDIKTLTTSVTIDCVISVLHLTSCQSRIHTAVQWYIVSSKVLRKDTYHNVSTTSDRNDKYNRDAYNHTMFDRRVLNSDIFTRTVPVRSYSKY